MLNKKALYLLSVVSLAFIIYVVYYNFVYDPQAAGFLSHKTNLKRPLQIPVWLNVMYFHVIFACLAMGSGIINFSSSLFERSRKFHRINGYVYFVSVFLVSLTSGYMAPYATGGKLTSIPFNLLNMIWPGMTVIALYHIKKRDIIRHRNWMFRSYAFCFTNLFIHLISLLCHHAFGLAYKTSYILGVYGSITLLLILPSLVLARKKRLFI
ncbi:DUF2306 domain-containing protein [Paenibacillus woosongensis]|uniref:DUF2306 domain-containing protein n=1 Tax=Paenibacillus woosongensis TaxID=307580 RepID=A0ABQ4MMN0_9BACL|nr:DUF2306 domain-containing protein [Paenibacillus woosongensis]GIP56922.1 hypothetical protein J15TS10_07360 [Paenibacillus woosongensis]